MTRDTTNEKTFRRYGLVLGILVAVLGLGFLGLFVVRSSFVISIYSEEDLEVLEGSPRPSPESDVPGASLPAEDLSPDLSTQTPSASLPDPLESEPSIFPMDEIPKGRLRISNRTNHPIRIALLAQTDDEVLDPQPNVEDENQVAIPVWAYGQPVHWDFAPEEGSAKGLLVSLPDSDLEIQGGDVLMAFAQDGSRRYWGPFVVGRTSGPIWDEDAQEWRLVLQL